MEDGGGPDPPLSSKLAVGIENPAAEIFGEEDDEEIMVEVVGSDVYVDGISGSGEGDVEMGESGDLEIGVVDKNEESAKISSEGGGKKTGEGGAVEGIEESMSKGDGEKTAVEEKKEGDGNETAGGGLRASESRDGKRGVAAKFDINLSNSVGAEMEKVRALLGGGVKRVNDEERNPGIKATERSSVVVRELSTEVSGASSMEICEEENTKDEIVDKVSSEEARLESLNHPVEKSDRAEEKSASVDSVKALAQMRPGTDGEARHDDSGELEKSTGEQDVCAAGKRSSVPETDGVVSEVPDESQNRSDGIRGAKVEPEDKTDDSQAGETEGV